MRKYIDQVNIRIKAGDGGNGCMSFYHNAGKKIADGGCGGDGGNVYLVGSMSIRHLLSFHYRDLLSAANGYNGSSNNKTGHKGADLHIAVPLGTVCCINNCTYEILDSSSTCILRGGNGGRGSILCPSGGDKISGEKTAVYEAQMVLKTIGDIGLIGLPNAGKSSFLNLLTNANVTVADYAFTTIKPQLGVWSKIVFVDIPGLVGGASSGKGMGIQFLGHITRCRILLILIDVTDLDPLASYRTLMHEMEQHGIKNRIFAVILNKIDKCTARKYRIIAAQFKKLGLKVYMISVWRKIGIKNLYYDLLNIFKSPSS